MSTEPNRPEQTPISSDATNAHASAPATGPQNGRGDSADEQAAGAGTPDPSAEATDETAPAGELSSADPREGDEVLPEDAGREVDDGDDNDDDDDDDDQFQGHAEPIEEAVETPFEDLTFDWYILKVQVNREDSICEALMRRVQRAGLDDYFREIIVPTEDVVEFTKSGKKRTVKRKLYPGYIMVNMALTEDTWFLVRETPGIGDFTGSAGRPTPMDPEDVRRLIKISTPGEEGAEDVRIAIPFNVGDRVRVKEGYFQNFEGDVDSIDAANGRVTVMINIFGRSTPVELQHWQMERL